MECARLKKLIKSWYMNVQDETMAPARMVSFMEQHVAECDVCLMDGVVDAEIARITAIVLPPSKIPKAQKKAAAAAAEMPNKDVEVATGEAETEADVEAGADTETAGKTDVDADTKAEDNDVAAEPPEQTPAS